MKPVNKLLPIFTILFLMCFFSRPLWGGESVIHPQESDISETGTGFDGEGDEMDSFDSFDDDETSEDAIELFDGGEDATPADSFLDAPKLTLQHEFATATQSNHEVVANRSGLRLEWDTLVSEQFLFKFDGKVIAYLGNDHLSEAQSKSFFAAHTQRELYAQASFESFSFKVGKQVVVWGEADTGVITDVISPRDYSEFIFTTLEDSRIGQYMVLMDGYTSSGNFSVFLNPDPQPDLLPEKDTRYDTLTGVMDSVEIRGNTPGFPDVEYGVRWKKVFGKSDVSVMAAQLFQNSPVLNFRGINPENEGQVVLKERYKPYQMSGFTANFALDNFLFKAEAAYKNDFLHQGIDQDNRFHEVKRDLLDMAVGFDYDANGRYQVTFETSNRLIFDFTDQIAGQRESSTSSYFNLSKLFLNETVKPQYTGYYHYQDKNAFHQFQLIYDITDNIELECCYTFFDIQEKESEMWPYRDEDRVSVGVKFYF